VTVTPGSASEKYPTTKSSGLVKGSALTASAGKATIKKKLEQQLEHQPAVSRNDNPKATSSNGTGGSTGLGPKPSATSMLKKNQSTLKKPTTK